MAPALIGILASACGRYADFTLQAVSGGDPNLTFTLEGQPDPVLTRGNGWDSHDVLNPSVLRDANARPALLNLYSGFDGRTWHTGLATSPDGLHWTKVRKVLSPNAQTWEADYIAANGAAVWYTGQVWYWYVAGLRDRPRIGLMRVQGHKEPMPVLEPGPYASWDEYGVADPYVIRIEPYFYMYYLGQDRALRQRLGVARSKDGVRWEKLRSNPILELGADGAFDEAALGEPAVWNSHGFYWMLYTGSDPGRIRRLGLARSTDGVRWKKLPLVFHGAAGWDSKVICDPAVLLEDGVIRVWFGGGDVASPDENLHGQIGYGVLRPVNDNQGLR